MPSPAHQRKKGLNEVLVEPEKGKNSQTKYTVVDGNVQVNTSN